MIYGSAVIRGSSYEKGKVPPVIFMIFSIRYIVNKLDLMTPKDFCNIPKAKSLFLSPLVKVAIFHARITHTLSENPHIFAQEGFWQMS